MFRLFALLSVLALSSALSLFSAPAEAPEPILRDAERELTDEHDEHGYYYQRPDHDKFKCFYEKDVKEEYKDVCFDKEVVFYKWVQVPYTKTYTYYTHHGHPKTRTKHFTRRQKQKFTKIEHVCEKKVEMVDVCYLACCPKWGRGHCKWTLVDNKECYH